MKRQWYKKLWPWIIVSIVAHIALIGMVYRPVPTNDEEGALYEVMLLYREPPPASAEQPAQEKEETRAEAFSEIQSEAPEKEEKEPPEVEMLPETELLTPPPEHETPSGDMKETLHPDPPPTDRMLRISKEGVKKPQPPDVTPVMEGLRRRIEEALAYPYAARKRGLQGVVSLTLRLDERGNLIGLEVKESSGYAVLDDAATRLVEKVVPYPHGLGTPLSVDIPIRYSLVN